MIWKLFAVMVAMSDTGSIAMTQVATDFVSQQACELAAHQLFPEGFERDLNGHHLVLRASAECRPDGLVALPPSARPLVQLQPPLEARPLPVPGPYGPYYRR